MKIRRILGKIKRKILRQNEPEQYLDLLKKCGLIIGTNVSIQNDVFLDISHCWLITLGDNCTLAPRVQVYAHDASTNLLLGYTKIGKVNIGDCTFVGAGSIILPGVTIGNNVIIGAGSVVSRDVPDGVVVAGNPLKVISSTKEYIERNKQKLDIRPKFPAHGLTWEEFVRNGGIPQQQKELQKSLLEDGIGFVQ